MAQITIETIAGGFRQMTAPAGGWITQSGEVALAERLYFRRRILLGSETAADWRVATEAEKAEYDACVAAERENPESMPADISLRGKA